MVNYELLDFTMKYIDTHPEVHDQGVFANGSIEGAGTQVADMNICGSQACFAGWASIFAGWYQTRPYRCDCHEQCEILISDEVVNPADGTTSSMMEAAEEALGISDAQATAMFFEAHNAEDLHVMVNALHEDGNADL